MEASALARASRGGLLARRSPLLRFEPDERLIKLIRAGHDTAFEALFNRYHSRLLSFCTSMLKSRQDAEDVLQEVFANAHAAMLADERAINVRPWLYRIARNRCLNHLRKPVPEGQDSMDVHPHQNGTSTAEQVQDREELRQVLADVRTLPETQRTALLLREIDQLSYEEIAQAMDTTVPSIKSLLVRARIGLAESSKARMLTCGEVQVELAEAAEGIGKASGPARKHVRSCDDCNDFRNQLRADRRALAALFPLGPLALVKGGMLAKLFGGGAAGGSGAAGSGVAGAGAVGGASTAGGVTAASGGIGMLGSALGAKAVVGVATAAILTAGAVEVRKIGADPVSTESAITTPPLVDDPAPDPAMANHEERDRSIARFTRAPSEQAEAVSKPAADPAPQQKAAAEEPKAPAADAEEDSSAAPVEVPDGEPAHESGAGSIEGVGEVPGEAGPGQNGSAQVTPGTKPPASTTTPPPASSPPAGSSPPASSPPPSSPPPSEPPPSSPPASQPPAPSQPPASGATSPPLAGSTSPAPALGPGAASNRP